MDLSKNRFASVGAGLVLSVALAGGLCPTVNVALADDGSEDIKWPAPTQMLSTYTQDKSGNAVEEILCAAKGTYNVLPFWLGITDTIGNTPGTGSGDAAGMGMASEYYSTDFATSALYGTYASPANAIPSVYLSNLWFTCLSSGNTISSSQNFLSHDAQIAALTQGQPTDVDTSTEVGGTLSTLYHRPDLVVTGNQNSDSDGNIASARLASYVNDIRSGAIGAANYVEGDESYDPITMDGWQSWNGNAGFQGSVRGTIGLLYNMADGVEQIQAEAAAEGVTKVTHAEVALGESAQDMAEKFEELFLGTQGAILKAIDQGTVERKTVAIVSKIYADEQVATISWASPDYQLGTKNEQKATAEYALVDVADNLAFQFADADGIPQSTAEAPSTGTSGGAGGPGGAGGAGGAGGTSSSSATVSGSITIPLAALADCDVLIYDGGTADAVNEAFAAGNLEVPDVIYASPTNVGSGNYDADKVVFTLHWLGSVYPEVATSVDLLSYFYSEIGHVSSEYLPNVMNINCAKMTLNAGETLTGTAAQYQARVSKVASVVNTGVNYIHANLGNLPVNLEPAKDATGAYRDTRYLTAYGTWKGDDSSGYWYAHEDGTYTAGGWEWINGDWYLFDNAGWMLSGWQQWGGVWYYLGAANDGAMKTGWIKDGGAWYFLDEGGAMQTGWVQDGGEWYYLAGSGAMQTGWIKDGGAWYYLQPSGAMATGWISDGGAWYYLYPSGAMATGWVQDGGEWYYLAGSGAMQTGWINDGGTWYYLAGSGVMVHDCWIGNYWLTSSGAMATNAWVDGDRYYVGADGAWVPNA